MRSWPLKSALKCTCANDTLRYMIILNKIRSVSLELLNNASSLRTSVSNILSTLNNVNNSDYQQPLNKEIK